MSDVAVLSIIIGLGGSLIATMIGLYGSRILNAVAEARQTREEIKDHISGLVQKMQNELHDHALHTEHRCTNLDVRTCALERDVKKLYSMSERG